jgi:hypothetical protein
MPDLERVWVCVVPQRLLRIWRATRVLAARKGRLHEVTLVEIRHDSTNNATPGWRDGQKDDVRYRILERNDRSRFPRLWAFRRPDSISNRHYLSRLTRRRKLKIPIGLLCERHDNQPVSGVWRYVSLDGGL